MPAPQPDMRYTACRLPVVVNPKGLPALVPVLVLVCQGRPVMIAPVATPALAAAAAPRTVAAAAAAAAAVSRAVAAAAALAPHCMSMQHLVLLAAQPSLESMAAGQQAETFCSCPAAAGADSTPHDQHMTQHCFGSPGLNSNSSSSCSLRHSAGITGSRHSKGQAGGCWTCRCVTPTPVPTNFCSSRLKRHCALANSLTKNPSSRQKTAAQQTHPRASIGALWGSPWCELPHCM